MDVPENGYGEQIMLCDPDSLVFGFLDEITSENSYEHPQKSYLSSVDIFFDVLILWNKDILVAEVKSEPLPTHSCSFTVTDGTDPVQSATVTIDGDSEGAKTTGSSGGCSATLEEGNHVVVVSKEGYETTTKTITVDESHTSFTITLTST